MVMDEEVVVEEAEAEGGGGGGQLLFEWPKWPNDPRPGKHLGRRQQACQSLAVYYTSLVQT